MNEHILFMKLIPFLVEHFENAGKHFHTQSRLEVVFGNVPGTYPLWLLAGHV